MILKWKPFNPDKRRKWYFLEDKLVSIDTLRYMIIFQELPVNITVYKAINKKHKGSIVNLQFQEPTYYVDYNAKQGGDGTLEKPFNNIKYVPSGNVVLANGVYSEQFKI